MHSQNCYCICNNFHFGKIRNPLLVNSTIPFPFVFRAECGIRLYWFLIIALLSTSHGN